MTDIQAAAQGTCTDRTIVLKYKCRGSAVASRIVLYNRHRPISPRATSTIAAARIGGAFDLRDGIWILS